MTHVINKMGQLDVGLDDLMVLFSARLKFSSDTVNLLVEKAQLNTERLQNKLILNPVQTVIVCFHCEWFCCVDFTGVNGLRESLGSGRHDIKLWEWGLTMRDTQKERERERWCQCHLSPSADMASNKKDWGEVIAWPCESCQEHLHWVSAHKPHCLLSHKFSLWGWRDRCEADTHFLDSQSVACTIELIQILRAFIVA